jgi:hypothetical protein
MVENAYTPEWFSHQSQDSIESAKIVVPLILERHHPKSVIEFGCGVGAWGSIFIKNGISKYIGVDGSYINLDQLLFDQAFFRTQDLNESNFIEKFDLCICLETAEHIIEENARQLVSTLCKSADVIIFSAAIPAQSGTNHVNEQWQSYWAGIFRDFGFEPDTQLREELWHESRVSWWYIQNLVTYKKVKHMPSIANTIDVVHPRAYEYLALDRDQRLQERDWAVYERDFARKEITKHTTYFAFLDVLRLIRKLAHKVRSKIKGFR